MKKYLYLFLILALALAACTSDDDSDDDEAAAAVERVAIGAADNLMLGSAGGGLTSMSGRSPFAAGGRSGVSTVDHSGDVLNVAVTYGNSGKAAKPSKIHRIKRRGAGLSKVRGALKFCGGEPWSCDSYVVDKKDRAHKLKRKPKDRAHKLKNATVFYERNGRIYYPDENSDLVELDISEDAPENDVYRTVRSGVVQVVMDDAGNWMLELTDGKVIHRRTDETEERMDGWPTVGEPTLDVNLEAEAETNRFFFNHDKASENGGFMFMNQLNVLYRTWLEGEQVTARRSNYNCWLEKYLIESEGGNHPGCYPYLGGIPSHLTNSCEKHDVSDDEYLFCQTSTHGAAYRLGDVSDDMEELSFSWAGHGGAAHRLFTSRNFLFVYGSGETYSRLTRMDYPNRQCFHLFSNVGDMGCGPPASEVRYVMLAEPTATDDNIIRFCGRRIVDPTEDVNPLLLVQISEASTDAPVFRETEVESCEQLENL